MPAEIKNDTSNIQAAQERHKPEGRGLASFSQSHKEARTEEPVSEEVLSEPASAEKADAPKAQKAAKAKERGRRK